MATILELLSAYSENPDAPPGPPVLVEADLAGGDLSKLPRVEERSGWRTQVIKTDQATLEAMKAQRLERLKMLLPLVSDAALVVQLVKSDRNPASHLCVGRGVRNDVVLNDATVSSLHAHLEPVNDTFLLSDQGSSNGTFLNQKPLAAGERALISSGDCVCFGQRVFYFLSGERLDLFLGLRLVNPTP